MIDSSIQTPKAVAFRAGQLAVASDLVDLPRLLTAYYEDRPDPHIPAQRVVFGTSGHRGSSFDRAFNEWHILAIAQAICLYRQRQKIDGPLFLGIDTHALSRPALASALEVLAANHVDVMLAEKDDYTPTPVISHAILGYNRDRRTGLSDGIVITPSHNPPECGGFKYNPPHGGPAEEQVTSWIEASANGFLMNALDGVKRVAFGKALAAATTHKYDYRTAYVNDLENAVDMEAVRSSGIRLGVDPLGGAGSAFLRRNGTVWTTDKDGIIAALLAAEITAKTKKDPGEIYIELTKQHGEPLYDRSEAPASARQKTAIEKITSRNIHSSDLAGEKILRIMTDAPGDGCPIGGVKVVAESGWFAARPSGTEDNYKIYAESFSGREHLRKIEAEAQTIVGDALEAAASAA